MFIDVFPVVNIIKTATELNVTLLSSACLSLGEISRNMALPLPSGEESDNEGEITKMSILNMLLKLIKSSSQNNKVPGLCMCGADTCTCILNESWFNHSTTFCTVQLLLYTKSDYEPIYTVILDYI